VLTVPSQQADFADWRQGREYFAVWAINVEQPAIRQLSQRLSSRIAAYLLPDYCRQAHITLSICGFPACQQQLDDDYDLASFQQQVKALEQASLAPFPIEIGPPATFASAPYLAVTDPEGSIACLRQVLGEPLPAHADFHYVPHVTLGLYAVAHPVEEILTVLTAVPEEANERLTVSGVSLMTYEAAVIGGPLETVCTFNFATRRLETVAHDRLQRLFSR
jgi:2'-5' RNA ligase